MKKLKLRVETLTISSFPTTAPDADPAGTVLAAEAAAPRTRELYCTRGDTCFTSCAYGGDCTCPI